MTGSELLGGLAILAVWLILVLVVFPRLGIPS